MKKTIRLTESDLISLVKRIINESAEGVDELINKIRFNVDSVKLTDNNIYNRQYIIDNQEGTFLKKEYNA